MYQLKKLGLVTVISSAALLALSSVSAQSSADLVAAALSHQDRPAEEAADDARRMPLEVLSFAGIEAGMSVLELEAGGGWYTEVLSRTVGSTGAVVMQNPPAFESFTGDADNNRAASLSNVTLSTTNFDMLEPSDGSMDLVTWILGPHELWFMPGGNSLGDADQTFSEVARVLKPGGRFLAVDHRATDDEGPEVGGTLHRIGEGIIIKQAEAAGLRLIRSSNLHINPEDTMTNRSTDPSIRGRTSKFVLLFEK